MIADAIAHRRCLTAVLVNSVICCLGCVGNEASILRLLTINLHHKFVLNVELIQAKKNLIKDNIIAQNAVIQPLATMQVEE